MERGELGQDTPKRVIFTWEGVAHLPGERNLEFQEHMACRLRRWDRAVGYWRVHELMVKQLWWLHVERGYSCDLAVTTRGISFAKAVSLLADRDGMPVRYVFAIEPHVLGRKLAMMPDVERVFYGLAAQQFLYGVRGYHVPFEGRGFQPLA